MENTMQAYGIKKYGAPEKVLAIKEVKRPVPKAGEVLVQVRATAINDYDWCLATGRPHAYRLFFGLFRPRKKLHIPGMEMAGTVVETGEGVTRFKPGDEVYADTSENGFGTFAEYISLNEKGLCHKPAGMSFEEAAAIPHAAMLALQGLREVGQLQSGQEVLINGGGGGVGAFGLQLAKMQQATVTGVDAGAKLAKMQQQGFDQVIDYQKEDFTRTGKRYHLILDCKTNRNPWAYLRALHPGGKYVTIGGRSGKLLLLLLIKPFVRLFGNKQLHMVALKANKDLSYMNELHTGGELKCIIDGPYAFDKLPWAIRHFGEGKHNGKVIIKL